MASIRISNQFGQPFQRLGFTGTHFIVEPPLTIAIDANVEWQINDSGSVTYSTVQQYGQQTPGQVFTLVWQFLPTGERRFLTNQVDSSITITTEETRERTVYFIKEHQNRLRLPNRPPQPTRQQPPQRRSRLGTTIAIVMVVALALLTTAVLAARARFPGTGHVPPTSVTMNPTMMPTITPTRMATMTPLQASMIVRKNTADIQPGTSGSAVTACQGTEQMVGGGFAFSYLLPITNTPTPGTFDAFSPYSRTGPTLPSDVESSYPKDLNDWTVVANNLDTSVHTLTVYADCVEANFTLGMQIIPSTQDTIKNLGGSVDAPCPAGSKVTGGGVSSNPSYLNQDSFVSLPGLVNSYPENNDWRGLFVTDSNDAKNFQIQGYALCATQNIQNATFPAQPFQVATPASTGDVFAGSSAVSCDAGQLLASGGFYDASVATMANSTPLFYSESQPDAQNPHAWDIIGINTNTYGVAHNVKVIADCLSY